jgi:hypothetical protein
MQTRRARRIKHKRIRRAVTGGVALAAVGLGIGFAVPATASQASHSGNCSPSGGTITNSQSVTGGSETITCPSAP